MNHAAANPTEKPVPSGTGEVIGYLSQANDQ